jgi:hypothetical protein
MIPGASVDGDIAAISEASENQKTTLCQAKETIAAKAT